MATLSSSPATTSKQASTHARFLRLGRHFGAKIHPSRSESPRHVVGSDAGGT